MQTGRDGMKRKALIAGLATTLIWSIATHAEEVPVSEPVVTPYMSVIQPAGTGWRHQSTSETAVTFVRPGASTMVATVMLYRMGPADSPEAYEALVREGAAKDGDPANPQRYVFLEQSIAYTDERTYPCVRYAGVSKDTAARGATVPLFLEVRALHCRHPADPSVGVAIMYSHRGLARHADLQAEADAFIRNVTLPER